MDSVGHKCVESVENLATVPQLILHCFQLQHDRYSLRSLDKFGVSQWPPTRMHWSSSRNFAAKSLWSRFVRGSGLVEIRFCELNMEWARAGALFLPVHCRTEEDAQQIKREIDQFSVIGMQWCRSFTIGYCSPRKDKPIVATGRPSHPAREIT